MTAYLIMVKLFEIIKLYRHGSAPVTLSLKNRESKIKELIIKEKFSLKSLGLPHFALGFIRNDAVGVGVVSLGLPRRLSVGSQ